MTYWRGVGAPLRRAGAPPVRLGMRLLGSGRTLGWPSFTRLFVVGDRGGWSVDEDAEHLAATARRLGIEVAPSRWARFAGRQAVFHTSQFEAILPRWLDSSHSLGVAYLHGRPGTPGMPEFDHCLAALRSRPERFGRIQVTHAEMHELALSAGVEHERVFRIPLGIDIERFPLGDATMRARAREALGLPVSAFVAGSFQKDGVGWGEGLEPKLIKGPDTLVFLLERLHERVPELVVLLVGPARGYVRRELERLDISYRHVLAGSRDEVARAYHALDTYLVTSRQEGGPKAVLESMAAGVPLVTTRVGQAQELVEHGGNGLLADVDDVEALVEAVVAVRADGGLRESLRAAGRVTAEQHAHARLDSAWAGLFEGWGEIVEPGRARGR
jgi:glycosyltransferase involved in cell wall biosynthesis